MFGHVVVNFGMKMDINGNKVFRIKDSNSGEKETIPVDRTTWQDEFEPHNQIFCLIFHTLHPVIYLNFKTN